MLSIMDFAVPAPPMLMRHSAIVGLEPTSKPYTNVLAELNSQIATAEKSGVQYRKNAVAEFSAGYVDSALNQKRFADQCTDRVRLFSRVKEMLELASFWVSVEIPATDEAVVELWQIVATEINRLVVLPADKLHKALVDFDIAYNLKRAINAKWPERA